MKDKKLGLTGLIGLVIGGIIGAGIFSLPSELAKGAGGLAILIGFIVSGIGVLALAFVYYILSVRKPNLKNGIYSYSKEGFGEFIGFNSAWIYWISSTLGNISYATLVFGTLSYFFKIFNPAGNNLAAIIGASLLIWVINFLILRGVKQALIINAIVNISKLIPILLFVVITIIAFNYKNISFQFFGTESLGSIYTQVKATMLSNLWAFGGIEAAVVLSARAKRSKDVGKATVIGIIGVIIIYMLVTFLSLGVMKRPDIAALNNPSLAFILQSVVGTWGAVVITITLLVSVVGALLGWTLITAEMPYSTAVDGVMPRFLAKENKNGTAYYAIMITTIITQFWLLFSYFYNSGYEFLYSLSSTASLIPYFLNTLYLLKLIFTKETYKENSKGIIKHGIIALISLVYTVWLLGAAGWKYTLFSSIISAFGLILYVWNRKEKKKNLFNHAYEAVIAIIIIALAIITLYLIFTGKLSTN